MRALFLVFGLLMIAGLALVRMADPWPVEALRETAFDGMQRLAPRMAQDLPVRVVDIDEASLATIGQWPWPRDRVASLVDALAGYGAAVVVFDVLFAEPDRLSPALLAPSLRDLGLLAPDATALTLAALDTDLRLATSMARLPVVLGMAATASGSPSPAAMAGFAAQGADPAAGLLPLTAAVAPLPVLGAAAAGLGVISISPSASASVVRSVPLVWRSGKDGQMMPSLSVEGLRVALGESTFLLRGSPDIPALPEALRLADFTIPLDAQGQMRLRYRPDDPALYVSAAAVMAQGDDPALRARLEGHIVLVGTSAAGLLDIRTTALGQNVPGVSIHAQVIEQILTGDYLRRDTVTAAAEVAAFVFLSLIVVAVLAMAGPVWAILAGGLAGGALAMSSWFAFANRGLLFDATFPVFGGFLVFTSLAAWQFIIADRDKRMIRRSFAHYVAPSVLTEIEKRGHKLQLGGVTRLISVMFCDIRNFTPMASGLDATALVDLLNRLFTELSHEILAEDGTIDKFIGDAVMAFWNAPLELPDHPRRAALAALRLRAALRRFNMAQEAKAQPHVALAIGLAAGPACVGNIGARDRFNYTAVGEAVNLAARIETACRHVDCDILISGTMARRLSGFALLDAGALRLKGVTDRLDAAVLVGPPDLAATPDFRELQAQHMALLATIRVNADLAAIGTALADCTAIATRIDPSLADFYHRIEGRLHDYH